MKLLFCTAPAAEAEALATQLVQRRLVACVNLVPGATSVYRWEGAVQREQETLLWMECSDAGLAAAMAALQRLHSYEVPKILALEPAAVNAAYLAWVREAVAPAGGGPEG